MNSSHFRLYKNTALPISLVVGMHLHLDADEITKAEHVEVPVESVSAWWGGMRRA